MGKTVKRPLKSTVSESAFQKAKQQAIKLLSRRDRTAFEIAQKLKEKEFPEAIVAEVLTYLKEIDLLNESRFIRNWSRFRVEQHHFGPIRLRKELLSKGLPPEEVDRFIDVLSEEWDPARVAELALLRRYKDLSRLQTPIDQRKAFDFLQRKGHSTDAILKAFRKNGLR